MDKRKANILLAVLGTVVVCVLILVAGGAWFALSVFHRETADDAAARAAFDMARERFKGTPPVFELQDGRPALTRRVPGSEPGMRLRTMHFIFWDSNQQALTRADVPLALLRLRDSPIDIFEFVNGGGGGGYPRQKVASIRLSDLERFGSALLVDQRLEDGHRLLVWTE
jgi:hypothetical protein